MKIRIGTRKSRLAVIQTELVRDLILNKFPKIEIELVPISTIGDKILDRSLTSFGGKGVFTKELDEALLTGTIDMAVHSAKDMPMEFLDGLAIGAVLKRGDPRDVLVTEHGNAAKQLPAGSIIGTSSLRRELQIKRLNPQVKVTMLRGNVLTRLEKLQNGEYDGIILAAAGLERLGLNQPQGLHLEYLDPESFVPASGQGILAVEVRQGEFSEIMDAIHSKEDAAILSAEREYLTTLGGGCNAPGGAYCQKDGDRLTMIVMYAKDGTWPVYKSGSCELNDLEEQSAHARQLARKLARQVSLKTVSLVGAGPGDIGLFTKKGMDCVRRADVIVYDNLISGSILNEARLDAKLLYVGKRCGKHHMTQAQINSLLIEQAAAGDYVVRLKGGDPFIFGRGGEEALALKQQGIPFEIIPGVSSCYSVPAYAGIPVTERNIASSFHVITGHEGKDKKDEVLDYAVLAKEEGTLIFLMGLRNLAKIAGQLITHGKSKDTPAAVIQQGTTNRQKMAIATLEHIADEAKRCGIRTPAIIIVGEVVSLHRKLSWTSDTPLRGKRMLVTGTRRMVRELENELLPLGADVVAVSVIESRLLRSAETTAALAAIGDYQWLVFTSGNGVEFFFELLKEMSIDLRQLMHLRFAVIGRKTKAVLAEYGFQCDFTPESYTGADLAREWIPQLKKEDKILMIRAREGVMTLLHELEKSGISYVDVPLYETWTDYRRAEEIRQVLKEIDYITLTSGSSAKAFSQLLTENIPTNVKLISIGPTTTQAAEESGLSVYQSTVDHTAAGITAAILADVLQEKANLPKMRVQKVMK